MPTITNAQLAQLAAIVASAVPDSTPPPPTPPAIPDQWTQYNSAYLGTRQYKSVLVNPTSGDPATPPVPGTAYSSTYVDSAHGLVTWGDAVEHHSIFVGPNGEQWGGVYGYGSVKDPSILYPEEVVKCNWTNLDTGVMRDMSTFTTGPVGGIMCPQLLPASGRYRICQWGWVWNALPVNGGVRDHPFYWQCDYLFGTFIPNPAWTTDSNNVRKAIKFSEAWWDESGWVRGTAPTLPWINGAPADVTITYDGWDAFGKGAGTLWEYRSAAYNVALASVA